MSTFKKFFSAVLGIYAALFLIVAILYFFFWLFG